MSYIYYKCTIGDLDIIISNEPTNENDVEYITAKPDFAKYNPSWSEYVGVASVELQLHLILLKKAITELGWLEKNASDVIENWNFKYSDGKILNFTNKGWGEFMSAVLNKREGYEKYYS